MQRAFGTVFFPIVILMALMAGCASSSTSSDAAPAVGPFSTFLVIGEAGDYNYRAQFERSVVSGIKAEGASASAFHVVVGGSRPPTREIVKNAIARGAFDAVVVTRVLDRKSDLNVKGAVTGTKVTRKDGSLLDLFRYDYEELDEPMSLTVDMQIRFSIELYDTSSERRVWSAETQGRRVDHVGELIDNTADIVVEQLGRAGLIGP